jgi:tetratricopeptide (TPR) repeat protein
MENNNTKKATKSPPVSQVNTMSSSKTSAFEDLYLKKDYKDAISYLLQNKQQFNSGIFHYNLGTIYSKMGDLPTARFHLEKTIKEGYINSSSLNNLSFVKSQLQVDDISSSTEFPDQVMNTALTIPPAAYHSFSLILLMLGILMKRSKKLVKISSIIFFMALIMLPTLFSHFYIDKINYAVAFKDLQVYEGPSKIFSEKGKVKAGSKIILGEYKEGWFYIKFPISLAGWISNEKLGLF